MLSSQGFLHTTYGGMSERNFLVTPGNTPGSGEALLKLVELILRRVGSLLGPSVATRAKVCVLSCWLCFRIGMPAKKRKKEEKPAPAAAPAAAGADEEGEESEEKEEKKGRGRPVGNKAQPVIDRLLAEDPLRLEKLWKKWGDKKTLVQLPPPYAGVEFACWKFNPPAGRGASINPSHGYGYVSPWGRDATRLYTHVLSHFIHTGEKPVPRTPKQDISHRCHRNFCFNPSHLVRETVEANGSRDYCLFAVNLGGVWHDLCPHQPKCLRPGHQAENFIITPTTQNALQTGQRQLAAALAQKRATIVASVEETAAAAAAAVAADDGDDDFEDP